MDTGYRIGAVAKLTGISTDTIRAWERRYGVVEPNRGENNNRCYTERHISKLIRVKRLVDAGQAIGTICRLSDEELVQRTYGILGSPEKPSGSALKKWAVISFQQPDWLKACVQAQSGIQATWVSCLEKFVAQNEDFIIIDMPSLSEANEKLVLRLLPKELASRCLVVYKFASRTQLRALSSRGMRLLKGPLEPFALVNLLRIDSEAKMQAPKKLDRRYSGMSFSAKNILGECSNELAGLVNVLKKLEDPSHTGIRGCQIDDVLKQQLVDLTVQARAVMEKSLRKGAPAENQLKRKSAGMAS